MGRSRTRSRSPPRRHRRRSDSRRRSKAPRGDQRPKSPPRNPSAEELGLKKQLPPFIVRTRQHQGEWVADVDGATVTCNSTFFCTKCHAKLEGCSIAAHIESKKHIGRISSGAEDWADNASQPDLRSTNNTFQSAGFLQTTLPYGTNEDDKQSTISKPQRYDLYADVRDFLQSQEGQTLLENQVLKIMMRQMGAGTLPMMQQQMHSNMMPPAMPPMVPPPPPHHTSSSSTESRLANLLRPIGGR